MKAWLGEPVQVHDGDASGGGGGIYTGKGDKGDVYLK